MHVVGIIAARMASTRFPDKPLALIQGIPMIGHVFHRSRLARSLDAVWIATCDEAIMEYAARMGAPAVLTSPTHRGATDRIAEALPCIEQQSGRPIDVAVLIQGDEPLLVPAMLDELVAPFLERDPADVPSITNLISTIADDAEFTDSNTVKVTRDRAGNALYLSREPIPSRTKHAGPVPMWKQLGLIAFSRAALLQYGAEAPTPLEEIESIDMNRVLENGRSILMVETRHRTTAVDTPSDLARVDAMMRLDPLAREYATAVP